MKNYLIKVYGRVQGVNFRNSVKNFCDKKGIRGKIMNKDGGDVLIIAQSREDKLQELIEWIRKNPGFSRVDKVKSEHIEGEKEYDCFEIVKEYSYLKDQEKAFGNLIRKL